MTIGIITFWQSKDNYGQILQAFALQKYLQLLGHQAFLIRYLPDYSTSDVRGKLNRIIHGFCEIVKVKPIFEKIKSLRLLKHLEQNNIKRQFQVFLKENMRMTQIYRSYDELQKQVPEADVYIAGSDQIWNKDLADIQNQPYFLGFGSTEAMRVSYAASFGSEHYLEEKEELLKCALSRFQFVSVREQSGVNICKSVGIDAAHVLDPTFLLDAQTYKKLMGKNKHEAYIYLYTLNISNKSEIYWKQLSHYARKHNLILVNTPSSGWNPAEELFGSSVVYDYATIGEWLANIFYSEMVVTPSFHGVVLSLLLNRPFIYVPLKGIRATGNNRVIELLIKLRLENRILESSSRSIDDFFTHHINWKEVNHSIGEMRKSSYQFIYSFLV